MKEVCGDVIVQKQKEIDAVTAAYHELEKAAATQRMHAVDMVKREFAEIQMRAITAYKKEAEKPKKDAPTPQAVSAN